VQTAGRNIVETIMVQVPAVLFGMVSGVFLTRLLGPEGKGVYTVFQANAQLMIMFLGLSFHQGLVFYLSNKQIAYKKLFGICLVILIFASTLAFVLVFSKTPFIQFVLPEDQSGLFYKLYLFLSFQTGIVSSFFSSFFQGVKRFRLVNIMNFFTAFINLIVFGVLFLLWSKNGVLVSLKEIFIISLFLFATQVLVYSILFLRQDMRSFSLNFKGSIVKYLKYIVVVHIALIANFFNYKLSVWVILNYTDTAELGYYGLALNFSQMSLLFTNAITVVVFPYFSSQSQTESKQYLGLFSRMNTLMILLLSVFLFFTADFLIPFLYGTEFFDSVLPFKCLVPGYFFLSVALVYGVFIASRGKVIVNTIISVVCLSLTVGLNIVLVQKLGIKGAAIASSVVLFSMWLLTWLYLIFFIQIKPFDLLVVKKDDFSKAIVFIRSMLGSKKNNV